MVEQQEHPQQEAAPPKRRKRRIWVLIVLGVVLAGSIIAVTYYPSPEFFFKIDDGKLTLYKGGWKLLGARQSNAVEPIAVEGADVAPLLEKSYHSLDAALSDYAVFMPEWIVGQEARVSQLEKDLAAAYDALLVGLRSATSVGLAEYEKEITRLERRIAAHKTNTRQ